MARTKPAIRPDDRILVVVFLINIKNFYNILSLPFFFEMFLNRGYAHSRDNRSLSSNGILKGTQLWKGS